MYLIPLSIKFKNICFILSLNPYMHTSSSSKLYDIVIFFDEAIYSVISQTSLNTSNNLTFS